MDNDSILNEKERLAYEAACKLSEEEIELQKAEAVTKCQKEHETMLKCMNDAGAFRVNGLCLDEAKIFWKCFREKRGFMQMKVRKWLDEGRPPSS